MPKGLPTSIELNSRSVSAFSLDTSIVEAAGFRFSEGPLRHLAGQLPPWLNLWMSDVVVSEISHHRLEAVNRAAQQVFSGSQEMRRHIGPGYQEDIGWVEKAKVHAVNVFDAQLQYFIEAHQGSILEPTHGRLAKDMFRLYFQGRPPFGSGRDKKHEFPDAASLLMLDAKAQDENVFVVAVSKDDGWKAYAERSSNVFCVSSLQELTALFRSDSPVAKAVGKRLGNFFSSSDAMLRSNVKSTIEKVLTSLPWEIRGPHYLWNQVDAAVVESKLKAFSFSSDAAGVWITSSENDSCVAELPVDVEVSLRIEAIFYRYGYDGEKVDLETDEVIVERSLELKLLIEMNGPLQTGSMQEMIKKMDVGGGVNEIILTALDLGPQIGRVLPTGFDDMDDIPF